MAPAADTDESLIRLQVAVAEARIKHQDLCERRDLMERTRHYASAQALDLKAQKAFNEFQQASRALAAYLSRRARGLK